MEHFYELSTEANKILVSARELLGLHLIRFRYLIDNSPSGFDCVHARMTKRYFDEDPAKEIAVLKALRDQIDCLIDRLERL